MTNESISAKQVLRKLKTLRYVLLSFALPGIAMFIVMFLTSFDSLWELSHFPTHKQIATILSLLFFILLISIQISYKHERELCKYVISRQQKQQSLSYKDVENCTRIDLVCTFFIYTWLLIVIFFILLPEVILYYALYWGISTLISIIIIIITKAQTSFRTAIKVSKYAINITAFGSIIPAILHYL